MQYSLQELVISICASIAIIKAEQHFYNRRIRLRQQNEAEVRVENVEKFMVWITEIRGVHNANGRKPAVVSQTKKRKEKKNENKNFKNILEVKAIFFKFILHSLKFMHVFHVVHKKICFEKENFCYMRFFLILDF
jgi:hypothetical protein